MARLSLDDVISMALTLLDREGLEGLTTRKLAQSLKIEQPTLYWHVRNKQTLMNMLSEAILVKHHTRSVPLPTESWQQFLQENALSFRKALLVHRDGARLHIGTSPTPPSLNKQRRNYAVYAMQGFRSRRLFSFCNLSAILRWVQYWKSKPQTRQNTIQ